MALADLHGILRAATAQHHDRLERLPFFQALHAGTLPPPAIITFLRCLAIIHTTFERCLGQVSDRAIQALYDSVSPKAPLLMADLDALDDTQVPSIAAGIRAALDTSADILTEADDPLTLVGPLYVLEGSQNGAITLKRAYARCLHVPEEHLTAIGCYGKATAERWRAFTALLDAIPLTSDQAQQIAQSAIHCFERLETMCGALYPYADTGLIHHIASVNAEAGDHAMPQDPRAIDVALRVGKDMWDRYPYLGLRFGERGRRFTCSDSCWLVAQAGMQAQAATKNLEWLRPILTTRGIPTIILETHLRAIAELLRAEFPD